MNMKITKQGIKDLNDIPTKKNTKKLHAVPTDASICVHESRSEQDVHGITYCKKCKQAWDWDGTMLSFG